MSGPAPTDDAELIKERDHVILSGGGATRIAEVKRATKLRLPRSGVANADSLAGMRFGEVVRLDHATKDFVACDAYPDFDVSELQDVDEGELQLKDNRNLIDDSQNQLLTPEEVSAIRTEQGVDALLTKLTENSITFHTKTDFAKEKYLKRKQKKYGTLFKVERVTPDNLAEVHFPTVNPPSNAPEETRHLRLRADTVALILHHSDVHDGSRVLLYDKTNGLLPAYLLTRLGDKGRVYEVLDRPAQPNPLPARQMGMHQFKERWSVIPRNVNFVEGACAQPEGEAAEAQAQTAQGKHRLRPQGSSQWLTGSEGRELLLKEPADSLIIADDERVEGPLTDLLPFLAYGGHLVVYSPFLEDLTSLFQTLRRECVNICISETWYRHHQVLPQRTHPTVNMSTAAGYLLTAIRVQPSPNARRRHAQLPASVAPAAAAKRSREETEPQAGTGADTTTSPPTRVEKKEGK